MQRLFNSVVVIQKCQTLQIKKYEKVKSILYYNIVLFQFLQFNKPVQEIVYLL